MMHKPTTKLGLRDTISRSRGQKDLQLLFYEYLLFHICDMNLISSYHVIHLKILFLLPPVCPSKSGTSGFPRI